MMELLAHICSQIGVEGMRGIEVRPLAGGGRFEIVRRGLTFALPEASSSRQVFGIAEPIIGRQN